MRFSKFSIITFFLDKFIIEKVPIFNTAIYEVELPKPGEEVNLYITYIKTANHFYATIAESKAEKYHGKLFSFRLFYF